MSELQTAISAFDAASERYIRYGACDTEPRAEFTSMLERLLAGDEPQVPMSPGEWQLYSNMAGADDAALLLSARAQDVVDAARSDYPGLRAAFQYRYGYIPR